MSKIIHYLHPDELRPHPLNRELYGTPSANTAYKDIRADMKRRGFDERHPLLITSDKRIIHGVTRHACAQSLKLEQVPCEFFQPKDPATAELEIERELVRGNMYRTKTELIKAREQRRILDVERRLGLQRMAEGSDGGPSKSTDRVGKLFGESGKSVQRRLKVLDAIEAAEAKGDKKLAGQLTDWLNAKQITKVLAAVDATKKKKAKPKPSPKQMEEAKPIPFHQHINAAISQFSDACAKATSEGEIKAIEGYLDQMQQQVSDKRQRLGNKNPPNSGWAFENRTVRPRCDCSSG
jgi:hypothetical protein